MSNYPEPVSSAGNSHEVQSLITDTGDGKIYMTYLLIAINVLVFVLMAMNGAGIMEPNGLVHIKWGSNYSPLTLSGDYWRLITNVFIHFGIIHLAMNMYCLYIIGSYLEPMLGKIKYITAYLCTGVLASLASLWWHTEIVNSAGASGAVFGLYGLFFAFLTTDLIPKDVRRALLQNIGIFIFYNLIYGMRSGVDNSAHIGGLVSGFIIGYLYVLSIKKEQKGIQLKWVLPLVIILTIGAAYSYLAEHKTAFSEREKILGEIKEGSYKDDDLFNKRYSDFINNQDKAMEVWKDTTSSPAEMKQKLSDVSLSEWNKADATANEMQQMDVGPLKKKKGRAVMAYVLLRKAEIAAAIQVLNNEAGSPEKLDSLRGEINKVVDALQ